MHDFEGKFAGPATNFQSFDQAKAVAEPERAMWLKLRILWAMIRLARSPTDYRNVEFFRIALADAGMFKKSVQYIERDPEVGKTMLARPQLPPDFPNLPYLRSLNQNTLGYQFALFVDKYQLDPQFFAEVETDSKEGYFQRRMLQIHDLHHVVLGQGTDALGELYLQGFFLAQDLWPPAPFFMGGYLVRQMFTDLSQVPAVMSVISEGWRLGKAARPLFAVDWEAQCERPLEDVRESLGLKGSQPIRTS